MLAAVLSVFLATGALPAAGAELLPGNPSMRTGYAPGPGSPVGRVQLVAGRVVILHGADPLTGYWAREGLDVYESDILVALEDARARVVLADESTVTLAPRTRVTIGRSRFDPDAKNRSSFWNLFLGKARFVVTKLAGYRRAEFSVKTPTAVCGVRGSDFVVETDGVLTEVSALEDTVLSVVSVAHLEEPPVILESFSRTRVPAGALPGAVERMAEDVIREIRRPFAFPGRGEGEPARPLPGNGPASKPDGRSGEGAPLPSAGSRPDRSGNLGQPDPVKPPPPPVVMPSGNLAQPRPPENLRPNTSMPDLRPPQIQERVLENQHQGILENRLDREVNTLPDRNVSTETGIQPPVNIQP